MELDHDLAGLEQALHQIDSDKLLDIQRRRNGRRMATLTEESKEYSLVRLIVAAQHDRVQQGAPVEFAESERIAKEIGRQPNPGYYFVPMQQRLLQASGSELVSAGVGPAFIHHLDTHLDLDRLGVRRLRAVCPTGLPAISGNATAGWQTAEGQTMSESNFTFAIRSSVPKSCHAYAEVSRHWLKQVDPLSQQFVLEALARAVAGAVKRAFLIGTGTNGQPLGLLHHGITALPAASVNLDHVIALAEAVESASAVTDLKRTAFCMSSKVAKLLRVRPQFSGGGTAVMEGYDVAGFPGVVTEAAEGASPNLLCFGAWQEVALLEYSVLQIGTDPYGVNSGLFKSGRVGLRALWDCDVVVLNAAGFAASNGLS